MEAFASDVADSGRDGAAGARNSGDEGCSLGESEDEGVRPGELFEPQLFAADPVGNTEEQSEEDEREGDDPKRAKACFYLVLEHEPEEHDRYAAEDDEPAHAGIRVAAGYFAGE